MRQVRSHCDTNRVESAAYKASYYERPESLRVMSCESCRRYHHKRGTSPLGRWRRAPFFVVKFGSHIAGCSKQGSKSEPKAIEKKRRDQSCRYTMSLV